MEYLFEFDPQKSLLNQFKHGIDFLEAQALWLDRWLFIQPARAGAEAREMQTGQIQNQYWTAITTQRGPTIRIISVRRARSEEVERYEITKAFIKLSGKNVRPDA